MGFCANKNFRKISNLGLCKEMLKRGNGLFYSIIGEPGVKSHIFNLVNAFFSFFSSRFHDVPLIELQTVALTSWDTYLPFYLINLYHHIIYK